MLDLTLAGRMDRRRFLRHLGYAAAGAATLKPLRQLEGAPNPARPLKVIVVGAGLSGMCAAFELEERGHEVTILEARTSHVGGRVRTMQFGDGLYGELGAMRIPAAHQLTRQYAAKFGSMADYQLESGHAAGAAAWERVPEIPVTEGS